MMLRVQASRTESSSNAASRYTPTLTPTPSPTRAARVAVARAREEYGPASAGRRLVAKASAESPRGKWMQMPDFSPCRYRPQLTICPRASATRSKTLPPRVSMSSSLQVDQSEEAARPLCTEDVARARDRAGRWDAQDEARRRDGAGRWRDRTRGTGRPAPAAPPRAHPRVAVATPASPASCGYAHPSLGGDAVPPQPLQAARVSSRLNVRTRSGARRARRRHLGGDYGDRAAAIPTTATERLASSPVVEAVERPKERTETAERADQTRALAAVLAATASAAASAVTGAG